MNKISLTASMRSNLLSLQNISRQVDATQNKLSTGNKVNSAIDNPSSYYAARSLNNRAGDLDALLDSMGQAVSTIKAATTALETGASFLEQAAAVATQVLESGGITTRPLDDFTDEGYTVITSEMDTTQIQALITDNAKLVLGGNITLDSGLVIDKNNVTLNGNGHKIIYTAKAEGEAAIKVEGTAASADIKNLGIQASGSKVYGIQVLNGGTVTLDNTKNISVRGAGAQKFFNGNQAWAELNDGKGNTQAILKQIGDGALAATATNQFYAPGTSMNDADFGQGCWYLPSIGELMELFGYNPDAMTSGFGTSGFTGKNRDIINDALNTLAAKESGLASELCNISYHSSSDYNDDTSWYLNSSDGARWSCNRYGYWRATRSFAQIENLKTSDNAPQIGDVIYADKSYGSADDYDGTKTAVGIIYSVSEDVSSVKIIALKDLTFSSRDTPGNFNPNDPYGGDVQYSDNMTSQNAQNIVAINNYTSPDLLNAIHSTGNVTITNTQPEISYDSLSYKSILSQYDSLIKDASYKGVNLLQQQDLKVTFNESRTSSLNVVGKDASAAALGLTTTEWNSKADIEKSIEELTLAMNKIRSMSSELGSYYNIVTTRQDFTENLINILEEGADKLTLADMNEESANMLALQTRQQLAVNSLSLASQAAQSILKLF